MRGRLGVRPGMSTPQVRGWRVVVPCEYGESFFFCGWRLAAERRAAAAHRSYGHASGISCPPNLDRNEILYETATWVLEVPNQAHTKYFCTLSRTLPLELLARCGAKAMNCHSEQSPKAWEILLLETLERERGKILHIYSLVYSWKRGHLLNILHSHTANESANMGQIVKYGVAKRRGIYFSMLPTSRTEVSCACSVEEDVVADQGLDTAQERGWAKIAHSLCFGYLVGLRNRSLRPVKYRRILNPPPPWARNTNLFTSVCVSRYTSVLLAIRKPTLSKIEPHVGDQTKGSKREL